MAKLVTIFTFQLVLLAFGVASMASPLCTVVLNDDPTNLRKFDLAVGQKVPITVESTGQTLWTIYLGRLVEIDNTPMEHGFYDFKANKIHFFPEKEIRFLNENAEEVDVPNGEKVAMTVAQKLGTCASYGIYNGLRQIHYCGYKGNGNLEKALSTERNRLNVFELSIHDYYADGNHRDAVKNIFGRFGFKDIEIPRRSIESFKKELIRSLDQWPVLMRFDVGSSMWQTPYSMLNHGTGLQLRQNLWQPAKQGENSSGGHMIVLFKSFVSPDGKRFVLALDSNWQTIRLWSLKAFDRLYSANIRAWKIVDPNEQ